ncbi:MAG: AAA family ATPase [Deltaproteobacteria bacterium]|nr:AAA family ATPase [Deltaproteobacteria bacterium]
MEPTRPLARAELTDVATRLQGAARILDSKFLDKQEIIRLLIISAVAGEHLVIIGPPGTAKSALIRTFARLVDARYFEYLLTRFTEPNEIFGPVDIKQFREGSFARRTEGMLPEGEIVFLDEVFKSNSAILNSLLTIMNERRLAIGGEVRRVPLISLFGASNEVPNDENLAAIFDRFLLRVVSENLDSYHFHNLVARGIENEVRAFREGDLHPVIRSADLHAIHQSFSGLLGFSEDFLAKYKGLIFQIRSEGISVSDRRVVKLLKLFAASALFDGRSQACDGDFFVLKHIWNHLEQVPLLEEIVNPVVDAYFRENPAERRFLGPQAGLEDLLSELKLIRELLLRQDDLSDIQLFSQLKNLGEIKAALQSIGNETALRMLSEVDQLLETVLASSKLGG